jgi:hypothetical protein
MNEKLDIKDSKTENVIEQAFKDYDSRHSEEESKESNDKEKPIQTDNNLKERILTYNNLMTKKVNNIINSTDITEIDFVKMYNINEILEFIQKSSRINRKLISLKKEIVKTKNEYLLIIKSDIHEREDIKEIKTLKERELAVDKIIQEKIPPFDMNIDKLQNRIDFYNNELSLARDIYKLKTLH